MKQKFNNKRRVFYEIKKGLVSDMECTTAFNDIKLYKKKYIWTVTDNIFLNINTGQFKKLNKYKQHRLLLEVEKS